MPQIKRKPIDANLVQAGYPTLTAHQFTANGFAITFFHITPFQDKFLAKIDGDLILNPVVAKQLRFHLDQVIQEYEKKHGPIKAPPLQRTESKKEGPVSKGGEYIR